ARTDGPCTWCTGGLGAGSACRGRSGALRIPGGRRGAEPHVNAAAGACARLVARARVAVCAEAGCRGLARGRIARRPERAANHGAGAPRTLRSAPRRVLARLSGRRERRRTATGCPPARARATGPLAPPGRFPHARLADRSLPSSWAPACVRVSLLV